MLSVLKFILIFILGVAGILATNVVSYFGDELWFLDYFAHFRLHYLWLMAGLLVILWLFNMSLFFWITLILLIVNAYDYTYYWRISAPVVPLTDNHISVLTYNQWHYNQNFQLVVDAFEKSEADVIFIHEASVPMLRAMQQLQWLYPYQHPIPERRQHSMAILSKYPWQNLRYQQFGQLNAMIVDFTSGNTVITMIGVHPHSPVTPERAAMQDKHLMGVAEYAATLSHPVIVAGDFNATPWSAIFRRFIDVSTMHSTVKMPDVRTTWPSWLPYFMQIPIDHILVSPHFGLVEGRRVGSLGSDHYAIQSTLVLQGRDE